MFLTTLGGVRDWMLSRPQVRGYYLHFTQVDTDLLFSVWFSFCLNRQRPIAQYPIPRRHRGPMCLWGNGNSPEGVDWFWTFSRWHTLERNVREFLIFLKTETALLSGPRSSGS